MALKIKGGINAGIIWIIILILIGFAGCKAPEGIFTIGVVSSSSTGNKAYEGFQKAMAESGYIEGKNIRYIYKGIIEQDEKNVDAGIRELLALDIDILLAFGRKGAMRTRELVKGTDTPVLFCGDAWPVEDGLVESINRPGGNITGVRPANSISKALEWLVVIIPGIKKVWVAYNPDEMLSVAELPELEKAASQLGVELIFYKIHSVEEAVAAVEKLPEGIDAIFRIPSLTLDGRSSELSRAAIRKGIPVGASIQLDEAVLITLTNDFFNAGIKTAQLAQQIHHGVKPADLPVETSEVSFIINLKTAEAMGLHLPDDVLAQAATVIR
jgi:putative ABC transport system substrate-binding protein